MRELVQILVGAVLFFLVIILVIVLMPVVIEITKWIMIAFVVVIAITGISVLIEKEE